MNEQHKIDAIAAWPVHVGGGDENKLDPLSYVVKEGQDRFWFYRIDIAAMMDTDRTFASEFVKITDEQNAIARLRPLIYKVFNPALKNTWSHRAVVSKSFFDAYEKNLNDLTLNNQLIVQCMPSTNGKVYIPGSSIKGSIRTAVLDSLAQKYGYENVVHKINNVDIKRRGEAAEKILLEYKSVQEDPFKTIKIADAYLPVDSTEIVKINNVFEAHETRSMSMFVEVIRPKTEFTLFITCDNETGVLNRQFVNESLTFKKLMRYSTQFYVNAIGAEGEHFYPEGTPAYKKVINLWDYLMDDEDSILPGMGLLRVGRFSHLESMSYNNRGEGKLCQPFDRKTKRVFSEGKTRNLVDGKYPLGAIVLKYA